MKEKLNPHPWETIYKREGRVFRDPFPGFEPVARKFARLPCRRILDLGCGNGRHVLGLKKLGLHTIGLDISPTGLHLAHAWLEEENLPAGLVCADARQSLPFRDGSFDGLLSTQVIHHALLAEVRRTIAEIWRVLTVGGLAFVTVAGRTHADTAYGEIEPGTFVPLEGSERGLPHHIFTEETLGREFGSFHIEEISRRDDGRVLAIWLVKN